MANVRGERTGVAALVELVRRERPDVFVVLELTPAFASGLQGLAEAYPHRLAAPAPGAFGIGLYSMLPLVDAAVFPLGPTDAVRATVHSGTGAVDLVGVHLLPPTSAAWATERNDQLLRIAALVRDREARMLVCGDFNLTPYSPYFARLLALTGLSDTRRGEGLAWTWPAGFVPLAVPIDHCLAGEALGVGAAEVLGDIGSDHYPLLIEITAGKKG
jgi:endonuclease/exonuclease/phosphatase (EEP) superfamily protein YafD